MKYKLGDKVKYTKLNDEELFEIVYITNDSFQPIILDSKLYGIICARENQLELVER